MVPRRTLRPLTLQEDLGDASDEKVRKVTKTLGVWTITSYLRKEESISLKTTVDGFRLTIFSMSTLKFDIRVFLVWYS